ncbi:AMP-binding protein [Rhodococcus sp. IEGM 1366]|uniref:class I adenylate-forming enzyme family protein n=1 Tax=Rhodococcus sp. IEGM 1366 TaxID=3082223 RepID=UPI00295422C0|nr:AMP-binding protein [Rhodococcus sp. IEGM 1366]MDV8067159.1 AMP-binding protein [Rhodococcus sp. IEGM 1366]
MPSNILRPLNAWATRQPDAAAIECGGAQLSWQELDSAAARAAAELMAHGVSHGDRVAIIGRSSTTWAATALGVLKLGAIICPLNERNGPAEIGPAVEQLEPRVVISAAHARTAVETALSETSVQFPVLDLEQIGNSSTAIVTLPKLQSAGTDPVCILSTSGSTGHPKGVVYTHESLLSAFFEWCLQEPSFMRARSLNVSSMSFAAGLLNGFLGPLTLGGSSVFLPDWDPSIALALIRDCKITHLGATTIFYEQMAAIPEFASADLSSLTVAFTGGNPVTVELIRAWSDKGVGLRQVYGLTESQSNATIPSVDMALNQPDSVGLGGVLNEFMIADANGTPCAPDTPGEILISGPGVAAGYWRNDELTKANFEGGWLHTGDIGTRDASGAIRIVGRIKDVIISGGMNIYAAEIERVIMEIPGILEVAVIGVPDDSFGETPAVLLRAAGSLTAEAVVEHCRARLARYKSPRYVEFLTDPLPRTAGMKINKAPLRVQFNDLPQRAAQVSPRHLETSDRLS